MFNAFNGLGVCWAHFGEAGRAGSVKKKKKKIELKQSLVLPRPEVEPRTVELQMCAHVCVYRRMCVYVCMCVCVCVCVRERKRERERERERERAVSYTHLRAHETYGYLVCRLLL